MAGLVTSPDKEKLQAAYALNLCTVSVSQIIDYDDIVILEQEYEAILNNLNIEEMPKDEALLSILKQLLDTITFFRIQEGDKQFIEREYQNKMKNAIWNAIPNVGIIMSGGNVASLAASLALEVGIGYMNYRKAKSEMNFEHEKDRWKLQRSALEQFNGLRRELFDTAWRLVDAHELPDEYRLTERQVKQYDAILMDSDVLRRYERLDSIKENFMAYPPFWYHFGNTANTISRMTDGVISSQYKKIAKQHYEWFVQSFTTCNLLRENPIASACALEYLDLLSPEIPEEKSKMQNLLTLAVKMSGNANDVLQLCAFAHLKLGDNDGAAVLFRRLINEGYNTVVNAQLLSGYYVSRYLAGDKIVCYEYQYLKDRIDEDYLYPMPAKLIGVNDIATLQNLFVEKQKEILIKKFGIVINLFQENNRIRFNKCIPVPELKEYTDAYFDKSNDSYAARKADGQILKAKNKKALENYIRILRDWDYPYNYLPVWNDMLKAVETLNFVQGHESELVACIGNKVIESRNKLKELHEKIADGTHFTSETYEEMLNIAFDDYTKAFFGAITNYAGEYVAQKNDIVAMNEAEMNLREFCQQEGYATPEELFETADNLSEEARIERPYIGIELIEDGVLSSVVNSRFDEVKDIILAHSNNLYYKNGDIRLIMCDRDEFDRYFINLTIPNKHDIRRKTVAILDDNTEKDNDLLFTTEGIMQITKGKMKAVICYDDIEITSDRMGIILHSTYSSRLVNMYVMIQMILALRSKPFAEVKDKKNPINMIAGIIRK